MGFFSKPKPILNEEDQKELSEIRRKAYLEEAKKIVEEQARIKAKNDLIPKKKEIF